MSALSLDQFRGRLPPACATVASDEELLLMLAEAAHAAGLGVVDRTMLGWYLATAAWVGARCTAAGHCLVIGINGTQGSGKSSMVTLLAQALAAGFGLRPALLSIDDLYLTRAERRRLATECHPLLATRGVPGTHDVDLGVATIEALCAAGPGERVAIPRFDKAADDRRPAEQSPMVAGPFDVVLFEGWCVGTLPQNGAALRQPINALEENEDPDGRWRGYVNAQLAGPYRRLFGLLDALVLLQAPSFDCVFAWRREQEQKLAGFVQAQSAKALTSGVQTPGLMDDDALRRFIGHYERLTRHNLQTLPERADLVLLLDDRRRIEAARLHPPE